MGKTLTVERGVLLQDALFAQGVEFPCGGRGRCKGCRIKLLGGSLPLTAEEKRLFTRAKLADGWRLACRGQANGDLKIEVAQWELAILVDDSVFAFTPQEGLGVAVDLGTTTVVAQLLDLRTGHVLAVRMALNAQAKHGADIMSRVEFAAPSGGQAVLEKLIREQLGRLIAGLLTATNVNACELKNIVIVGNTVMHHLFCGLSAEPLSRHPFDVGMTNDPALGPSAVLRITGASHELGFSDVSLETRNGKDWIPQMNYRLIRTVFYFLKS